MSKQSSRVFVIGFGNPGRQDDGLGPALAEAIEKLNLTDVTVDSDYQLVVEDAAEVAVHDVVVFVDAAVSGAEPFSFEKLVPEPGISFSSHSVKPQALLALAQELFQSRAEGYLLAIRGYAFDTLEERLTDQARTNLNAAISFLTRRLTERNFDSVVA